jgi:hypothetical protein
MTSGSSYIQEPWVVCCCMYVLARGFNESGACWLVRWSGRMAVSVLGLLVGGLGSAAWLQWCLLGCLVTRTEPLSRFKPQASSECGMDCVRARHATRPKPGLSRSRVSRRGSQRLNHAVDVEHGLTSGCDSLAGGGSLDRCLDRCWLVGFGGFGWFVVLESLVHSTDHGRFRPR